MFIGRTPEDIRITINELLNLIAFDGRDYIVFFIQYTVVYSGLLLIITYNTANFR
jgi:hypothetical protein